VQYAARYVINTVPYGVIYKAWRDQPANVSFHFLPMTTKGTLYSVTTGSFREAEPQRLLFGDEPKGRTVPSVPFVVIGKKWKLTFAGWSRQAL